MYTWKAEKLKNGDGAGERYDKVIEKMKKTPPGMAFENIWLKSRKVWITGSGQKRLHLIGLIFTLNRHLRKI